MSGYKSFFMWCGNAAVRIRKPQWSEADYESITVEDLYQQFKARMLDEMRQDSAEAGRRHVEVIAKTLRPNGGEE